MKSVPTAPDSSAPNDNDKAESDTSPQNNERQYDMPQSQDTVVPINKPRRPTSSKILLCIGFALIIAYVLMLIMLIFVPERIIEDNHYKTGSLGNWGERPDLEQKITAGISLSFFLFIPCIVVGITLIIIGMVRKEKN